MKNVAFTPDYNNLLSVLLNQRPPRLPLYEHHIDAPFISKVLGEKLNSENLKSEELDALLQKSNRFLEEYDL